MGKLPAFLFYPKDWRNDPHLMMCSRSARSVWIDMLCLMFFSQDRGVCATDGKPWSDQQIAGAIGGDIAANLADIRDLLANGVAHRNSYGAIFSRRMVRDERERQANATRVRKHRVKANETVDVTPDVMPLSGDGTGNGNAIKKISESYISEVYKAYPRKVGRGVAYKAIGLALQRLLRGEDSPGSLFNSLDDATVYLVQRVRLYANSPAGQAGEYTPHPATWFNQKRYLDDESEWSRNGKSSSNHQEQPRPNTQVARAYGNLSAVAAVVGGRDSTPPRSGSAGMDDRSNPSGAGQAARYGTARPAVMEGEIKRNS